MLPIEQVRVLIAMRLIACCDSCNSYHINHVEGQIKALCAVINNGVVPPTNGTIVDYLDTAGIPWAPYIENGEEGFWIENQWFINRGCTISKDGSVSHPNFKGW